MVVARGLVATADNRLVTGSTRGSSHARWPTVRKQSARSPVQTSGVQL